MTEKTLIKTPQLGESITEGIIISINKKQGDFVENGKVIFELETEKVTMEIVSTIDGIIENIFVKIGEVVKVGSDLASVIASQKPSILEEDTSDKKIELLQIKPEKKDNLLVAPSAYKIAIENNIDLSSIKGSGSKGHILKEDVLFANSSIVPDTEDELIEFSDIRKNAIKNAQNAQYLAIHSIAIEKINVGKMVNLETSEYLAIFIKAIAICIEQYPNLNALVFDDKILFKKQVNIALETELGINVIQNIANKTVKQIIQSNEQISEPTIYVCHSPKALIMTPAISGNQAMALAICRIEDCYHSSYVNICIRFDNRVATSLAVSEFLEKLKKIIENPYLMLTV